jgi:methylmalonyl-CoA mutase, N-terminal domain
MTDRAPTPLYGPADWTGDPARDLGAPGRFPFTRGPYPTMYTERLWTMRQYAGFGTAEETNTRFHHLLAAGQSGLSTAFDLPTQMGLDSDHPLAEGEVGRVGVAIDTVDDLALLFRGIPLDQVSTSMTINATAAILLAMYVVVGEEQGVSPAALSGTIQNDILKEYIARGTYIFPPAPSLRLIGDIFRYVSERGMNINPISISGYHMREAGATAAQEVGFTLANALEYVRVGVEAGLPVNSFGPRLSFFFAAHNNLFEEAAKFRAARRLWARLVQSRFGADDTTARLRFHTQTGGVTLQAQQPLNNVVRVTIQALSAVLGGAVPAHQRFRRGARPADRRGRHAGAADPADPRVRERRGGRDRPAGWQLFRRGAHRPARSRGAGAHRGGGCTRRGGGGGVSGALPGGNREERLGGATAAGRRGPGRGRGQPVHR